MKSLIIAEKPSAAQAIAEALGGFSKRDGYLENQSFFITWAFGHLIQLAEPEDYVMTLKRWRLNDLPIIPEFQLRAIPKAGAQLRIISSLAKKSNRLINACDSAREGELVFRYITSYLKLCQIPTYRLWTASLTKESILDALANMKPAGEYDQLYASARCRSEGDWLVGINATRAFTTRFGMFFSLGRVQTPVLAMICENRRQRDSFHPETYWQVQANFQTPDCTYRGRWFRGDDSRIETNDQAQEIKKAVEGCTGSVQTVGRKESRELPPKLYDLTSLQRECNRIYGFSASKTLSIAQNLYERKWITYPRTNSRFLDAHGVRQVGRVLEKFASHPEYGQWLVQGNPALINVKNRNLCRPESVEDHHAILPTTNIPKTLTPEQAKVYDRIVRRLLVHLYLPARYMETRIVTRVEEHHFRTDSKVMIDPGWRVVEGSPVASPDQLLLPLHGGELVLCAGAGVEEKQTEPQKPFTEGSLLGAMETAGKRLDDEELREVLKDAGLGTPATRSGIIERLKEMGYIELNGKVIEPTGKGMGLIRLIEKADIPVLLSAEMTGRWEKYLNQIARGQASPQEFSGKVTDLTIHIVQQVKEAEKSWLNQGSCTKSLGRCPRCGGEIIENKKAYTCSSWKKENCPITIWKTFRGKRLTEKQALSLLEQGQTALLKLYTRDKKPYKARVTLDRQTGRLDIKT